MSQYYAYKVSRVIITESRWSNSEVGQRPRSFLQTSHRDRLRFGIVITGIFDVVSLIIAR